MELIAAQTGGLAYHDTNDLRGAIAKALEDSEVSYTLGFHPDSGQLDSEFHALSNPWLTGGDVGEIPIVRRRRAGEVLKRR